MAYLQKVIDRILQIKVLLGVLIFLVVADGVLTKILTDKELATELNPFLKTWVEDDGFL